jgi:hypothetical protein
LLSLHRGWGFGVLSGYMIPVFAGLLLRHLIKCDVQQRRNLGLRCQLAICLMCRLVRRVCRHIIYGRLG